MSADKWTPNKYAEEGEPELTVEYDDRFYTGRNYDLFAILANVRNGRGFAGCDTGDGFKPIAMPKGLPQDVSKQVKIESDYWGIDGHSHSWLTLAEMQAYDWKGQITKHRGWVDPLEFQIFEHAGKPKSWCGSVDGPTVKHISNDEMRKLIKSLEPATEPSNCYTQVEWVESYYDCAKNFLEETMPKLDALSYGKPENIRIVFWFDN